MINRIILSGDNYNFVSSIMTKLEALSQHSKISFSLAENLNNLTIPADEVLIYINSIENIEENIWDLLDTKNTSYVTAQPKSEIMEKFEDIKCLAVQRHLSSTSTEKCVFLGALKNNVAYAEPFIRESSLLIFDLDAIRAAELQYPSFAFPSGLFSEDATQMFRYAGMNELNKAVVINNATATNTHLISQFIWYFAEAAEMRIPDHPYFTNTVNEYIVNVDSLDLSISFYKSKSSGRWWVKIPDIPENKWKSCSYEDYQNACEDNLSTDLLNIISAVG